MKIFAKLIPITFILCLVCFGISIIFNDYNLTYLQQNITPNGTKIYTFDFQSYIENINIDILKRATTNIIDTTTFTNLFSSWKIIWENGYNLGDIFYSLINIGVMTIDIFIVMINIPLIITRILAGILLTTFSLLGININQNGIITTSLKSILDFGHIPYLQPVMPTEYNTGTKTIVQILSTPIV